MSFVDDYLVPFVRYSIWYWILFGIFYLALSFCIQDFLWNWLAFRVTLCFWLFLSALMVKLDSYGGDI